MKNGSDFGPLPYLISAMVLCFALPRVFLILKGWFIRGWRVTAGEVKETMLLPHAALVPSSGRRPFSFAAQTQYVAIVTYTFDDAGIERVGRMQEFFANERAAHNFLAEFHEGHAVSVRYSSVWPHSSILEFEPAILRAARSFEHPCRKAASVGWICRRALFLFGIALAVCVAIGLALLAVITITHRS